MDFARISRFVIAAGDCPVFLFAGENRLAFARRIDRHPVENVCVDANKMPVTHIIRPGIENLFGFLRERVNKSARREADVDLILFFFRHGTDLEHLALLVVLSEERDRSARLGQAIWMQIAAIVGHELLNVRCRDLRDQIADLLIVAARAQRLYDFPMIAFLLQLHLTGGGLQHDPRNLRGD